MSIDRETTAGAPTSSQIAASIMKLAVPVVVGLVLLLASWPDRALPRLSLWIAVFAAAGVAGLELVVRLGLTPHDSIRSLAPRKLLAGWIAENAKTSDDDRFDLFRQVFYDGQEARAKVFRYVILMLFASVIASAGVIADATAVVIGAMLIAPLITPMMGMALGLTMGWPSRLIKASWLAVTGIGIAVGVGWLVPFLVTTSIDVELNNQIASRSSPTLLDLVVAIAAGAAGAYALARPGVSSSLPGVAVAIALVPPLSVVGLLLNAQEWRLASGAGLLFATNLVAILITGGLTFLVCGVAPLHRLDDAQNRLSVALSALFLFAMAVIAALAVNGASITADALDTDAARSTTVDWLTGSDLRVQTIDLTDDVATVILTGAGDPPPAEQLADELEQTLGRRVTLDLQWIPRNRTIVPGD